MKNIFLLLTLFLFIGCGGEKVKHPAPTATPDAHAGHDHSGHDHSGHDHATDNPNITTNPDGSVHVKGDITAFLVGIWEVDYALIGSTPKVDSRYKGAWIEMNPDFSFTSGVYEQETNKGTYKYQAEPTRLLTFNFEKEEQLLPTESRIQGHAVKLVLIGKTPMDGKNSQIKIGQTSKKPTRPN